jgi:hypothetical protein
MYSEYKSKGLIPDDFPELTILQLRDRLDVFIKNKLENFAKQNMTPLTNLETYRSQLVDYQGKVFLYVGSETSWFNTYMDKNNFYLLRDKVTKVYIFKKEINDSIKRNEALSKLNGLIIEYNKKLNDNKTCGTVPNSGYEVGGKFIPASIPNRININIFSTDIKVEDIDIDETYIKRTGKEPTSGSTANLESELKGSFRNATQMKLKDGEIINETTFYIFEGENRFMGLTKEMETERLKIKEAVETEITNLLSDILKNKNDGVGFVPNLRNVLAVIFASGEAFIRIMDDVHTKAWEQRDNDKRKNVVFNKEVAGASQDNLNTGDISLTPVYPWPQVILATNGDKGQEKYEIRYPGDSSLVKITKADDYTSWPEVEFVEEFVKGFVQRTNPKKELGPTSNELYDIKRVTFNAIEFPVTNQLFSNKEEVKYFYEIYERLIFISNYSKLSRAYNSNAVVGQITEVLAESEKINIVNSLSNDNPFIIQKLKNYGINSSNIVTILQQFSNGGVGESWQNYVRGIFNTKYIKNIIENSQFEFISPAIFNNRLSQPQISITGEDKLIDYITGTTDSNKIDFTDTFPFNNLEWVKSNLADGTSISDVNSGFDTRKVLNYSLSRKTITNFSDTATPNKVRPITNFITESPQEPQPIGQNTSITLKTFYEGRVNSPNSQIVTEGNIRYRNYSGFVSSEQTTSMLNTPYFVNAIQDGIKKFREYDKHPFVVAAYLFLNSLPLSTLREKYKSYTNNQPEDLNYIFASLKKFGAVHKMPYAWILKMGSIWYRYKKFVETGVELPA